MPQSQKHDPDILRAALIGLQHTIGTLEQRIADLRSQLGGQPVVRQTVAAATPKSGGKRKPLSAAARRSIALAQKKRWAAYNAAKAKPAAAAKAPKRVLSAEGRANIIAATKKRWAALRKAQQAPKAVAKPVAKKAVKRVAKAAPEPVAAPAVAAAAPAAE
jgi:hypothetical protein